MIDKLHPTSLEHTVFEGSHVLAESALDTVLLPTENKPHRTVPIILSNGEVSYLPQAGMSQSSNLKFSSKVKHHGASF